MLELMPVISLLLALLLQGWQCRWSRLQYGWTLAAAWAGGSSTWAWRTPAPDLHVSTNKLSYLLFSSNRSSRCAG
jgi:hypothetical protein